MDTASMVTELQPLSKRRDDTQGYVNTDKGLSLVCEM
jgi:hypothetical protein